MRPYQKTLVSKIAETNKDTGMEERPSIQLSSQDNRRLRALISSKRSWLAEDVRSFLAQELDRAVVFAPEQIAPDVVTMNSRALFRRDSSEVLESRTLVYDDAGVIGPSVCVFTMTGAALLGLAAGNRMPYADGQGKQSILVVEKVSYQPEAHAKRFRRRAAQ